ncbi:hypothetical protein PFMC_06025, partial [Plasmodium falciparum CAMP/Malaysia]
MYETWIDNQKKEFLKQKRKYTSEMQKYTNGAVGNGTGRTKGGASSTNYDGYEKIFYEEFKRNGNYGTVDKFLEKLNDEDVCKKITDEKEKIDFKTADNSLNKNINKEGTFYHSEYCEVCPGCGVDCDGTKCTARPEGHEKCKEEINKIHKKEAKTTNIEFLFNDKPGDDIVKKLNAFYYPTGPHNKDKGIEDWKCSHYSVDDDECVMQKNGTSAESHPKRMQFVDFFLFWVTHLFNDVIEWRNEISKCITESSLKKCSNRCNRYCRFFKKWVEQKKTEWGQIKRHFDTQEGLADAGHDVILEVFLEQEFLPVIEQAYGDKKSIQKIVNFLKQDISKRRDHNVANKEEIVQKLLDHELEDYEKCKETHNDDRCSQDTQGGRSGGTHDHEDDSDDEEPPTPLVDNACSGDPGGNTTHRSIVNRVAHHFREVAHNKMKENIKSNSVKGSKHNVLEADATKGIYKSSGNSVPLTDICSITEDHSNRNPKNSSGPCYGKDGYGQRFVIGTNWEGGTSVSTTPEIYLPPRRQHMCTSNLENLNVSWVTENGKASHSLLGDVLLSAKMDAIKIIQKYNNHNVKENLKDLIDEATACRAMKYSFADIGDIIRGRDLWDEEGGMKSVRGHLEKIFGTLHRSLDGIQGNKKYNDDDKKSPPYKQLREDWWEANRSQVWDAMKCSLPNSSIKCGRYPPFEDYIPQRLRWMTEWAEWYCKMQKEAYEKLMKQCKECKDKGDDCRNNSAECSPCKQACEEYKTKIETWRKQWKQMEIQYTPLYLQAKKPHAGNAYPGADYQQMVHFFKELQEANGDTKFGDTTSPYFTAERYIHQELPNVGCNTQTEFCDQKNGNNNINYTFKHPPKGYKEACDCKSRPKSAPEKKDAEPKVVEGGGDKECEKVNKILQFKKGKTSIEECHEKNYGQTDPDWKCGNETLVTDKNTCMPPRRQKLCLYYLTQLGDNEKEDKLREAFIKTAAAETFLSWHYYKSKNDNSVETQLKEGTIPPEFLRSMYFTYGDYRDICLNTDISKKEGHVGTAKTKIDKIFPKPIEISLSGKTRQQWWEKNGQHIWKGMLCGLTHGVTETDKKKNILDKYSYDKLKNEPQNGNASLEDFAKKPQFLRWMIEWGEEF